MKVLYRQAAGDDLVRQFRYYLLAAEVPEVAIRFQEAVRRTVQSLRDHPRVGPRYSSSNPRLQKLRSWPVAGFEAIRIYYLLETGTMHIVRILHGKRDVRRILESE
ncbi:MAG: type II toxin-antitoxin system RelE/ParE family toxin [Candidatus Acidiferrum sp.]